MNYFIGVLERFGMSERFSRCQCNASKSISGYWFLSGMTTMYLLFCYDIENDFLLIQIYQKNNNNEIIYKYETIKRYDNIIEFVIMLN